MVGRESVRRQVLSLAGLMGQGDGVHYIGIDLAWGDKQPTGLAVIDDDARLLLVSAVRTDDEIEAALAAYVAGDCLAAIDAPIVVTNATGSRPAEQQLSRDFRRYDAATHPSNTGKPEFANGTRAARVAKRLGLDIDPQSGRRRRAIEVYPHPATIVLFGLPKVLRYKAKPGRDLDLLRSELLTLMSFVATAVSMLLPPAGRPPLSEPALRRAPQLVSRLLPGLSAPGTKPGSRVPRSGVHDLDATT